MSDKRLHTIYDDKNNGTVQISQEVISIIAGIAATEVQGIASMKGNIHGTQLTRAEMKSIAKCVKTVIKDGKLSVYLLLNIRYGYSLPEVTKKVQERVKDTLENMTGLEVESVNISISDVQISHKKGKK